MKTFIFLILLLSSGMDVWALSNREVESIKLVKSLIMKLKTNKPFVYSEAQNYSSLMDYTILFQLGYQDKAGRWLKAKPKYSYICELLRQNRELILSSYSRMRIYASATSLHKKKVGHNNIFVIDENKTFVYVTLEWIPESKSSFLFCQKYGYKTVTFKVLALKSGYKKLYLDDTIINGKPLPYLLGFRRKLFSPNKDQYIPYFPDENLKSLKKHIDVLR